MIRSAGTVHRTPRLCALAGMLCLFAGSGWAQALQDAPISPGNSLIQKNNRANANTERPQPAPADPLPGAKARAPVVPSTRGLTDLAPNDALFDAINRGDLATARDALNRGADLHAVNMLGMTPMELSVDLGRNDISFLLLSMRGGGSDGGGAPKAAPSSATQLALEKAAAGPRPRVTTKPARSIPVANKPLATPKLFANDGGTPQPNAGFLGFDPRSSTN